MNRKPLILIVIMLSMVKLYGQPGELVKSEVFSTNEGLGHRIALDIGSDTEGQYYINSPLGLQRYSKGEINATIQIPNLSIHQAMIQNENSLSIIDIDNCVHVIDKNNFKLKNKFCVIDFIEGNITLIRIRQNKLFVLTQTDKHLYTLYQIEPSLASFRIILEKSFESRSKVIDVSLSQSNEVLFIDSNEVFHRIGKDQFKYNPVIPSGLLKMEPKIFENTKDGTIYFSCHTKSGVYRLIGNEIDLLHEGFIHTYNEDEQGDVIIGASDQTINFINDLLYIEQEQEPIVWNDLIADNSKILDFHSADFSNDITLASYNGIYHYFINPMHVQSFLARDGVEQGDFGVLIRCIGKAQTNKINALKESGEVVYQLAYDSAMVDHSLDNILGYGSNWFEYSEEDTSYHFGSYNGDFTSTILKYNTETKEINRTHFPMTIERFYMDRDNYWAIGNGSESGKVLKIDRENGNQRSLFDKHLLRKDVRSCLLLEDYFMVGTNSGLYIYDRKNQLEIDKIIPLTENLHITCIRLYDDHYFIGTQNTGLKIFTKKFKLVKEIEIGSTRPSNTIAAIEKDTFGNFWVSTFDGITILNKDLLLVEKIELEDGLSSSEFNRDASFKDGDGTLYFGNLNGYTRINPNLFFTTIEQDDYLIDEVRYTIGTDQIFLSPTENRFNIRGIPNSIQIKYYHPGFSNKSMMPNLNRKDIKITPKPDSISFENDLIKLFGLKKGTYNITVSPRYGIKSPQTISTITFSNNYDWLFGVIVISSIIGLISYLISSWVISIVRKESAEKITLQNELSEIRMKALRSQLNPHFIFNSLNSIQYYIQVNEKRKARDYLSKFAKLMRMVLQSSHDDVISMEQEIAQIKIYLELEKLRFEDRWDYKLNVSEDLDSDLTTIPSMLFQPIIENAIIHGLGNLKERKGTLNISIDKNKKGIIVEIEDNGVGRAKSTEINSKKLNKSKSLSTSISKDRIALYNKFESDKISIDYTDKYAASGEPTGTIATINITTS